MQILTPSGYKDIADCAAGDEVSAFDAATGAPIVNTIEKIEPVDAAEFRRWQNPRVLVNGVERFGAHTVLTRSGVKRIDALAIGDAVSENDGEFEVSSVEILDDVPAFDFYRINDRWTLFREQSIWRNGTNVCHARDLVVGDVIYDDQDQPVTVTSVEQVTASLWYRFDISGDHSFISDDLTLHNASRFWIGGTGTWDAVTTTNWSATTGPGTPGASVPGVADTVTLDANSGGGTVTLNFGGMVTIQSLTMGQFTGTFDNSVNNNNFTLGASGNAFNGSGNAVRTFKLGTATYTLTAISATFAISTVLNLTFSGASSTLIFSGNNARQLSAGVTLGTVTFGAISTTAGFAQINNSMTIGTLNLPPPNYLAVGGGITLTVSNAVNWIGSSTAQIGISATGLNLQAILALAAGSLLQWCAIRDINFIGSPTVNNSFDLGDNSGATITPPGGGGGGFSAGFF